MMVTTRKGREIKRMTRNVFRAEEKVGNFIPERIFRVGDQAEAAFPLLREGTTRFRSLLYRLRGVMPNNRAA